MKKVLKWVGVIFGGLLGVVVVTAAVLYLMAGARLNARHDIEPATVVIPTDSASIERGRHLASSVTLCQACHGDDLAGQPIVEEPGIAAVYASNLTSGRGGKGAVYTDADFVRAIRHGVKRDGKGILIMHADAYNHLDAGDLGSIIAYVKSVPPVDNDVPVSRAAPLGRIFIALGMFDTGWMPLIPAEVVDHSAPIPPAVERGPTAEYGAYLVSIAVCHACHGPLLQGGPPIEQGGPPPPNIASWPIAWSEQQFIETIRTGTTPYGKAIDGESMPYKIYGHMTDDELSAIWRYIVMLNAENAESSARN